MTAPPSDDEPCECDERHCPGTRTASKRKRLKLDPCLADGVSWTIVDDADRALLESIRRWMDEGQVGEAITLEIVEMTAAEVEGLPDI